MAFYAPDYEGIDVGEAAPQRGPEGVRRMMAHYWGAFPDLQFSQNEIILQEGQAALFWTARGTHQGRLLNIPPTGHPVVVEGVSLLTVQDNKITRGYYIWDMAGLLRNIGLLPEL
jgi:steroid delta-isomerase-like uncharacterized protein